MSRIGKKPIEIPESVKITYKDKIIEVKGEKGSLSQTVHQDIDLEIEEGAIKVKSPGDSNARALQGLTRSLIANMVTGVSKGFMRELEINGIGYKAEVSGDKIIFNLGYSHPINFALPDGIKAEVDRNKLKLFGYDKIRLGMTAASIRDLRPPEPYKGKGIKYADEYIRRKAGKTGAK